MARKAEKSPNGPKALGPYSPAVWSGRQLFLSGQSIKFVLVGGEVTLQFSGVITDKDNMKGTVDLAGQGSATFSGTRAK